MPQTNRQQTARALYDNLMKAGWSTAAGQRRFHLHTGKKPIDLDEKPLASNATPGQQWALREALGAFARGLGDGIGVQLGEVDGVCLVGLDIDHCYADAAAAEPEEWARALVADAARAGYAERSLSGTGLHHIAVGRKPAGYRNRSALLDAASGGHIEVYDGRRYFTLTGNVIGAVPLNDDTTAIAAACARHIPADAPTAPRGPVDAQPPVDGEDWLSRGLRQDAKLHALWNRQGLKGDESADDLALFSRLAYWLGKDAEAMRLAALRSPYCAGKDAAHRRKWDREDYMAMTIGRAIAGCSTTVQQRNAKDHRPQPMADPGPGREAINPFEDRQRYFGNVIAYGRHFADRYKGVARFAADAGCWYVYDGKRWARDESEVCLMELTKQWWAFYTACALQLPADTKEEQEQKTKVLSAIGRHSTTKARQDVAFNARSVYPVRAGDFDRGVYLFNCRSGTLNLQTGTLQPHNPEDLLSRLADVAYDPSAQLPRFVQFIDEITNGDREKARYLQKWMGLSLSGFTGEKKCVFLYGSSTSNGKSTLTDAMLNMMGDYGRTIQANTLEKRQFSSGGSAPSPDLAMLAGARFVSVAEPDRSIRLDAGLLKQITGGMDALTARFLHRDFFTFYPQCKIFLHCNSLPATTDDTLFSSDRVQVIPFERSFAPEERDPTLADQFRTPEAASALLNWALEGWRAYRQEGMCAPLCVQAAVKAYREDSDIIGQFVQERLEPAADSQTRLAVVYQAYQAWCWQNGYVPVSSKNLRPELDRHTRTRRTKAGIVVMGVHVKSMDIARTMLMKEE